MSLKRSLLLLLATMVVGCSSFDKYSSSRTPAATFYVDPQYYDLQILMADALNFRAQALQFADKKNLDKNETVQLTREEGEWLRSMGASYLQTRQKLLDLAIGEATYFANGNQVKLDPYKGTRSERNSFDYAVPHEGDKKILYIDPKDPQGEKHIFRIHMALASALMLMDNYLVAIQPYNSNDSLKYILNYDTNQYKALQSIADSYSSPKRREQLNQAVQFVDKVMAWRRANGLPTSPEESHLYALTQSSIWYLAVKNNNTGSSVTDVVANLWNRLTLRGKRGVRVVSYGLSMGFGNMVGLVETRKGYLNNMSDEEKAQLIAEMKPLDVLMEKTPFRLTDKMIPGHYGHVAIWVGTEAQLRDLQVWDQLPADIQTKIRSGHHIIEALRPGVQINTLEHFLNIDDFLVLRDHRANLTDEYRRKALLQAVAQIGKEYDFNFDVNTHERIVCSEIAYVVFADVKWPLDETLRRYTISPDNVAKLAVGNNRLFEPVIMYYGGKRVYKELPYSLSLLLKADDKSYKEFEKLQSL
ncbi:MAG: YiiX/YebB-like N1pC/P60 family cysteine hydrolase [Bdellovibrio sp.]